MTAKSLDHLEEHLYEHLTEELKDYAIFMITLDGMLATWNKGVKRILGYDEHEFLDKPFSVIFTHPDRRGNVPAAELEKALASGRAEDERYHLRKDGTVFWASGLLTLMKAEDGTVRGFTKIMRDQTQKKKREEELLERTASLTISNRELINFAGIVSHDLKAPLQTMSGFATLLKDKLERKHGDNEVVESVEQIANGAGRMIKLIDLMLNEAKNPQAPLVREEVDSKVLVDEVLLELSSVIQESGARVLVGTLPPVSADRLHLGRVFQNIIGNACKFCVPGRQPQVEVSASEENGYVHFAISDNGRGIPEEKTLEVFTLFHRGVPFDKVEGHGIGLGTCRKIIESLGGRIWVESKPGQGSTFHFTIPSLRSEMLLNEGAGVGEAHSNHDTI